MDFKIICNKITQNMTPKEKGHQYSLLVTSILEQYKTTAKGKYVHLIKFRDDDNTTYTGEEVEDAEHSNFRSGVKNIFELTNPGKPGTYDWVRFVSIGAANNSNNNRITSSNDMAIAQTAFNNAAALGLQRGWSEDDIIQKAYKFAGNIKLIAKRISEDL